MYRTLEPYNELESITRRFFAHGHLTPSNVNKARLNVSKGLPVYQYIDGNGFYGIVWSGVKISNLISRFEIKTFVGNSHEVEQNFKYVLGNFKLLNSPTNSYISNFNNCPLFIGGKFSCDVPFNIGLTINEKCQIEIYSGET